MRAYHFSANTIKKEDIIDFLRFTCNFLKITSIPNIQFVKEPITNSNAISFAAFSPTESKIMLYIKNRHILDVFRSLAHEMVHYKQSLEKSDLDGTTGSEDENEANSLAGQIMRLYGKNHPEMY